jgi:hypothetical protein
MTRKDVKKETLVWRVLIEIVLEHLGSPRRERKRS